MKLRSFVYASALVLTVGVAGCQNSGKKGEVTLTSKNDSVSYALGVLIGESNKQQMKDAPGVDQLNKEILIAAFQKAFMGDSVQIKAEVANSTVQNFFAEISKVEADKNTKASEDFLAANKNKAGVITLPSGLQYEIIKAGTGVKPKAEDQVKCHYHGTTIEGKVFDSSVDRGEPTVFPVNRVIPGWTEALQLMPVGSKWKLYIPSALAYGERGAGQDIKPNSALIFEVELLEIVKQ
ncbi:MAG: FKBP-type peptidyl-prolyl cis-trans isomerase [Prolixibacteraceae bacterium]|jgi:FKBP-type peptidyl-prolyl cis-trans isomerase|nr:FKBP-type peptidyl-prolyl cis-trans isomerase [Prolixibacteraceae bacterium]